ncbi:centrosome and spindle pole-associated protein 1 isoform X3 [Pantherophis guttatus]|uniref:Centrosome and spindle pole-associated protein 1 isoform X3 n=1 Tax=Pantherophis guttatus TaxID=94885 RepID=A0A6P9CS17_PANGU|nr:centrosome and spindle pole-associated protein 1 isoform X3 [Pantherophis guttatus]
MMAENLDKFLEDHKARLLQDKAKLENDPPYMEMQNKSAEKLSKASELLISMAKENIPPNSQHIALHDYGLSLPLGEDYEHKKHKLKEELRQDYRQYLSQGMSQAKRKKRYLTSGEVDPYTQGLSLPICDRRSAKDRLRLERNKEYNQYLREKEEWNERLRRVGKKQIEHDTDIHKQNFAVSRIQSELYAPNVSFQKDEESSKKDAYTSTDTYDGLSNIRLLLDQQHKQDIEPGFGDSLLNKTLDEKLNISSRKQGKPDGKPDNYSQRHHKYEDHDPEINDEMDPRFRYESDYDKKPLRVFHAERSQGYSPIEHVQTAVDRVPYATGLILGSQDRDFVQKRKEQYRQELIEQMAEQQRNKRREKELELSVAASGVVDPEKKPNRLKELGLKPEEKIPPERPRPAFYTPSPGITSVSAPPVSPVNEDFHRGLSSALGEVLAPRIAPLRPSHPPPILTDSYRTPYDDAYYFYGTRNPLDPSLAYYGAGGTQPSSAPPPFDTTQKPPVPISNIGTSIASTRPKGLGIFPEEKPKPTREATLAYQQELQQQIREREERRRQEKEEKERYEAKLEAEMRNYNPWGKGGGGAPLRDKKGNLITDLNIMHKQNEDAYHNPEARVYEDKRAIVSVDLSLASPRLENTDESTNKTAGFTYTQTSPFARGNVFGEHPSPEQLRRQESYKNFLRFQIEEKRKREDEEREKRRIEEEREERKLAEQRARIQREYEEELEKRRKKEDEQRLKNEELYKIAEERRKEAERRKIEEEEEKNKQDIETEKYLIDEKISRHPSPLIPTLQSKPLVKEERTLLMNSRLSYYTQDVPRAQSPPVPARRNQLRTYEEKKNVINELSEMRKQLRSEERRLQEQLLKVYSDDDDEMPGKGKKDKQNLDVFEMARLRMQAPVRRPSSKEIADPINLQNIREFNELKYKDSETRVETRHLYPDPPTNNDTLDIQQLALLREQKKKLKKMRKNAEGSLDFDEPVSSIRSRDKRLIRDADSDGFMKTSLLESESAFIDTDGETYPILEEHNYNMNITPSPPVSARERRREKKDDAFHRVTPPPQLDNSSLHSNSSLNIDLLKARNEERLQRLNELHKDAVHIADDISLGNGDDILKELLPRDGRRPSSIDSVATEPWLRPGTSETLKRLMAEQSSQAKPTSEKSITFNWQGLSTAHG